jgi:hypothetical protein
MGVNFGRRLLLSIDAKNYGESHEQRQRAIQAGLLNVLDTAARRVGLDRPTWDKQPAGDGELAVLPFGEPELEVVLVHDFVRELHDALTAHNADLLQASWLRLRLAIHYGTAMPAPNGYSGQGVVTVSRLVDSAQAKTALNLVPDANLVLVLSVRVFSDVIVQRHTPLRADDFRRVMVRNKTFAEPAHLYLPGHDIHAIRLADDAPEEAAGKTTLSKSETAGRPAGPNGGRDTAVQTTIHGNVDASHAVFGIANWPSDAGH